MGNFSEAPCSAYRFRTTLRWNGVSGTRMTRIGRICTDFYFGNMLYTTQILQVRFIVITLALAFTQCNTPPKKNDALQPVKSQQHVFIKKLTEIKDSVFIDADYIQFLMGKEAIEAAKKAGEADTTIGANGQMEIGITGDYFILNENNKIRRLRLADSCKYRLIDYLDREYPLKNDLESLKKIYDENFFLLTIENNIVTEIEEVYTP